MRMRTTLPISEARKRFFTIAEEVQKPNTYYTLTERGRPKAVIVSANRFEALVDGRAGGRASSRSVDGKGSDGFVVREGSDVRYGGSAVMRAPGDRAGAIVVREAPRALYLSGQVPDSAYHAKELAKAQLYVELVEKYKYPVQSVEVGRCVKVGGRASRRYIEADIVVEEGDGDGVLLLFAVSAPQEYISHLHAAVQELFELAAAFAGDRRLPIFLVYYTRSHEKGKSYRQWTVIDHSRYGSYEEWRAAGEPCEGGIPTYPSLFARR
jgi:prevent-host-death family protein